MLSESVLARAFVQMADSLVDDFDVVDLLTLLTDSCVSVLDISAAGLMLASPEGDLRVLASSEEAMHILELFELQSQEGPCLDCYRTGAPVNEPDLDGAAGRWPLFRPEARRAGFRAVHALPMRLRGRTIGALNLFSVEPGGMGTSDIEAAQALADIASIAILQNQAAVEAQGLSEQLSIALNSRVLIEQAKGVVAERDGVDMAEAFTLLRTAARNRNQRLVDIAQEVITHRRSPT